MIMERESLGSEFGIAAPIPLRRNLFWIPKSILSSIYSSESCTACSDRGESIKLASCP